MLLQKQHWPKLTWLQTHYIHLHPMMLVDESGGVRQSILCYTAALAHLTLEKQIRKNQLRKFQNLSWLVHLNAAHGAVILCPVPTHSGGLQAPHGTTPCSVRSVLIRTDRLDETKGGRIGSAARGPIWGKIFTAMHCILAVTGSHWHSILQLSLEVANSQLDAGPKFFHPNKMNSPSGEIVKRGRCQRSLKWPRAMLAMLAVPATGTSNCLESLATMWGDVGSPPLKGSFVSLLLSEGCSGFKMFQSIMAQFQSDRRWYISVVPFARASTGFRHLHFVQSFRVHFSLCTFEWSICFDHFTSIITVHLVRLNVQYAYVPHTYLYICNCYAEM